MRLIEAWVSLSLSLLLSGAAWRVAALQTEVEQRVREEALDQEALFTVAGVLDWELGGSSGRIDAEGGIALRAFRGWGRVCAAGAHWAEVTWQGIRRPDPSRDSLLLIGAGGAVRVRLLTLASARSSLTSCGEGSMDHEHLRLEWTEPLVGGGLLAGGEATDRAGVPVLVRAFEAGSYVPGAALRYRRGQGSRQPVTAERFTGSAAQRSDDGVIVLDLQTAATRARLSW